MHNYLDFEKPISDLEGKIHELRKLAEEDESIDTTDEVGRLEVRAREAMADIYAKLTPWQKTQVARHPSVRIFSISPPAFRRVHAACR
jgi:acetyl-CoA carboxylase carboxyl transferase subunit alpha